MHLLVSRLCKLWTTRRVAPAGRSRATLAGLAVLLAAVTVAGCAEDVVAPPELGIAYTLWGTFDPTADVQAVRVVPIADTVGLGSTAPLPIVVTSEDLATGEETAWRDSVVTYANGSVGHVYVSDFRPRYGSRHVFRVRAEAGREVSALVAVPPLIDPIRQPTEFVGGVRYPLLWIDAPQLNNVRATYVVEDENCQTSLVTRELPPSASRPVDLGWTVRLPFDEEGRELRLRNETSELSIREVTLDVEVASEDWRPPGGVFDPELLIEPGTLSNVTGGFGFVGAAYPQEVTWRPTPDELSRAGFQQQRFGCPGG